MKLEDLEQEYSPTVARRTHERTQHQATRAREEQKRRIQPIETREELSTSVAELAASWGLKRKKR